MNYGGQSMENISDEMFKNLRNHFGYSKEEMQVFISNVRNQDILSKTPDLLNKTIIIEVIEARGCNSQHKVGDKFYFDGAGNLLTKYCPKRICIYALGSIDHLLYTAQELFYAGVDPNEIRFNRASCIDIGLKCGGWGNVLMEIQVVERMKLNFPK